MHAVFVPEAQNEGSAFMDHVVLIWTTEGHTYGVGVRAPAGISRSLQLAKALAQQIELTKP
jgi:hypothetical protein